ncbi:ribonuclease H [Streptomyces griseus]|uniref:Ribonuclease H n=5 Tax=Streptomyces TaxID=1883 RepID=B1VLM9_STRGG|nr:MULTISPECIES: ribonuclease H [Streptomyces]MBW3709178.1 ribonuclease HI [Streptomyces griseus]MYR54241.1 ribonuclease HI [Streptomyces sp. SID4928]MYT76644.1 ribonuclease HI [Streptomyces sp. SID8364]BAG23420.1 putative ribonuclease H [Streptomyces griseus subsp. griseus NBRC 13350]
MNESIIAACDGASKGNPGPAAWAWVVADALGEPVRWEAGPLGTATNNVAELTALAQLLESIDPAVRVEVRMDSQYAMNAVTKWLPGWKRNGWKTSAGKPVANRELVTRIDALLADRPVTFRYVPAHQVNGDPLNAIADQAADEVAVTQLPAGTAHGATALPVPSPARATKGRAETAGAAGGGSRGAKGRSAGGASRSGRSGGTIKARFAGRCHCGKPYAAQEPIAKNPNGWGHPECRTAPA